MVLAYIICPSVGIGRQGGLKILWAVMLVPVRVWSGAHINLIYKIIVYNWLNDYKIVY